jgi:hypothetical protein
VRKLVLILGTCAWLGASGHLPSPAALNDAHVRELLSGIFEDVGAILTSFSGGPEDARGPVQDRSTLMRDSNRLDAATRKAEQLATELSKLQTQTPESDH